MKVRDKPVILESPTDFKNRNSSIVNLLNIQWLIVNTIIDQGDHKSLSGKREKGHSGPKLKSMVLMSQGLRSLMIYCLYPYSRFSMVYV